jgi:hypothetical protein
MSADQLSRRETIAALAALSACALAGDSSASVEPAVQSPTENFTGPTFAATGPDAEFYGAEEGYPIPDVVEARRRGDPWEPKYRVRAFTHLDQIYPTRRVERATSPWKFNYSTARYTMIFAAIGFRPSTICRAIQSPAYWSPGTTKSSSSVINMLELITIGSDPNRW